MHGDGRPVAEHSRPRALPFPDIDQGDEPMTKEPRYTRKLRLSFAAVVFTFILATLYVNWRTLEIGAQTRNVSLNALPSIGRLTNARDDLRDIEVLGTTYADVAPDRRTAARDAIEAKWREVDRELGAYSSLPVFPGERDLSAAVPAMLRASDEAVRHFVDTIDSTEAPASRSAAAAEVHARIDIVSDKLRQIEQFNADHAQRSADQIEALRDHTAAAALALDGLAVIVAIAATTWLSGLFRDHALLLSRHSELVEERATELEAFGRRVAHDLLSPLSSLTYCLTAFKRAADADPALADAMVRARACVQRAQTMVDGIFEFARSGGKPEPAAATPLKDVVDQVVEEVRSSDLRTRPEIVLEPLPNISLACNPGVLTSVLSNLMRNAQKFMSDSPMRKITLRGAEEDGFVRIEVEDTGPGVPPEIREAIFEPYVRAEGATQPGLGLGLATVKRLCAAHGGDVGVRSVLGHGATFWFKLPKADASSASRATPIRRAS
jgi:signal transduction histidine kinase